MCSLGVQPPRTRALLGLAESPLVLAESCCRPVSGLWPSCPSLLQGPQAGDAGTQTHVEQRKGYAWATEKAKGSAGALTPPEAGQQTPTHPFSSSQPRILGPPLGGAQVTVTRVSKELSCPRRQCLGQLGPTAGGTDADPVCWDD